MNDNCRLSEVWKPMWSAPKDQPILALCKHVEEEPINGKLSLYAAHAEGLSHVEDGVHVIEWGGGWGDRSYEEPNAGFLPDWWFLSGSDFEVAANPIAWLHIPTTFKPDVPTLQAAMHASAPQGYQCADCYMDNEPCPTCYHAWWSKRHPNTDQIGGYSPTAQNKNESQA